MAINLEALKGRVDQAAEYLDGFLYDLSEADLAEAAAIEPGNDIRLQFLQWRAASIKEVNDWIKEGEL